MNHQNCGQLTVILLNAALTHDVCTFGKMDPICTLTLSNGKFLISTVKKNKGKFPQWNETVNFIVEDENILLAEVYHQKELVNIILI